MVLSTQTSIYCAFKNVKIYPHLGSYVVSFLPVSPLLGLVIFGSVSVSTWSLSFCLCSDRLDLPAPIAYDTKQNGTGCFHWHQYSTVLCLRCECAKKCFPCVSVFQASVSVCLSLASGWLPWPRSHLVLSFHCLGSSASAPASKNALTTSLYVGNYKCGSKIWN